MEVFVIGNRIWCICFVNRDLLFAESGMEKVICGVMALLTVLNMGHFYVVYGNEVQTTTVYGILDKNDYISSGEYLPTNTVGGYMNWRKIVTDESAVTVEDYNYTDGITTFLCTNTADKPKTVEIPLLNYDNYHAYALADGQELEIRNGGKTTT